MSEQTVDYRALEERLEAVIDSTNLVTLLRAVASVCYGKAEHLRDNWQSPNCAKVWEQAATRLERVESFAVENKL